ncbi:hypothetical protein AYL99_05616 [Fonsecaea erecta]|uniref:Uncharacterized protein n=1 Tax=Fonsecaea erecta TaxID=1367422 RepID=A0A178ZLE0_9EURO|nr:hypothetical protein AYL99_05616 [Fonsecaea erecta]OAP60614.1 hypothetical protein AYL99_05616 [Fonsecaea erecta]
MSLSKLAASYGRSSRTCRPSIRTYDFFSSRPPRSRYFTHKASLLVVARPILRPQLPFLYPFPRGNTLQTHVGRFISTERKQRWKEQFWRYVRINAYLWPAALLLTILSMGMVHTKLERDYPTPGDWSFWSRWWMREAKFTELADGAKVNQILTDWAKAGRLYLSVLERLENEKVDGQFLIKHAEKASDTTEGFDVNAKSEQWRRGYHEALMGAARVAEHLEGMCKLKGDTGGGRVYPWESIPSPNNPRPKPLPYDRKYGHISPPTFEEVEDAFPPPAVFYEKILNTIGFDTRQRLDAALAYADWCDFKGNSNAAEAMYVKAAEIAQSGLPTGTADVIDVQSGLILKGREDAVSDNILRVCTAFGVHHVREGNVKKALPVFLSVLRARKTLPASPLGPAIGPSRVKPEKKDDSWLSYVYALKDLLVERPYPPPPPTGNERPYHTLKEACEEVGLMTYIGEILFATSDSERAKGLSWTRDSVEAAEAIMWVMDEQKEQDGRDRCRECLETGLQNWKAMSQQMARLAAKKEQEVESSKGLFGLGLGRTQQLEKARTERRRWDEENLQVELRRQKTLPLLQEPLQPTSGGWLSTLLPAQQSFTVTITIARISLVSPPRPPSPNVEDLEAGAALLILVAVWFVMCTLTHYGLLPGRYLGLSGCINVEFGYNPSTASIPAFEPPENSTYRAPDTIDTFQNYAWRNHSKCQISSLDLHAAFSPLCATREDFLQAFSGGGRIGFDRPFIPLACDMRWFTTEEVCEIFSRFERVIVVGDSMMRHVVGALNVLLRKDLGYGAVTNWNFNEQELQDCFCNHQMDVKSCSVQGIFSTSSVQEHDPSSLACPPDTPIDLVIEMMLRFPLDSGEVQRYRDLLSPTKPAKPYAFIFGHGLWNDLDLGATLNWLDGILEHTLLQAPYLSSSAAATPTQRHAHSIWPRLFITPNAAGIRKPDQWLVSQGDKALMIFEEGVRVEVARRGVEAMGTWNMSVQAEKYDGVHLDLKGNLVKAMGVVNWLNLVDVAAW